MIDFFTNNFFTLIIFGLIVTILGIYQNYRIENIKKFGIKTDAQIVEYIETKNPNVDSYNRTIFSAVVKFIDRKGTTRSIIHGFGTSSNPKTILPKRIKICYLEENGKIEIIFIEGDYLTTIATITLILGLTITITTFFFYFYKNL